MDNPFIRRATEFFPDAEAFLAIVSPEPISYFLENPGSTGRLYDRLVIMRGTPGSGKTTLARVFELPTIAALLRNTAVDTYRALLAALTKCHAIADDAPAVVGCRLPLETDYRDFWEFPYPDDLKLRLMAAMIQARAVLGWTRHLASAGIPLEKARIVPRADAVAAVEAIGGTDVPAVASKARAIETALYTIVSALIPPDASQIPQEATSAYRPFDVIEYIEVEGPVAYGRDRLRLRPLLILDDAQTLHRMQFKALVRWLTRRELRVARWILTRLDIMHPGEALATVAEERAATTDLPGISASRETTEILLQSVCRERHQGRPSFRKMAKDMASRYLSQMPLFSQRNLRALTDLLPDRAEVLSQSRLRDLESSVASTRRELRVSESRYEDLQTCVAKYLEGKDASRDIALAMVRTLLHRYSKRTSPQRGLFDATEDPEPARPLEADASVYDAARLFLLHKYEKPYYFGMDDVCDSSSENIEQFLHLAAGLVEAAAAQLIRSKPPSLDVKLQDRLLREKASDVIRAWSFPLCHHVESLTKAMAARCLVVSLEPNAPLGAGANAFGIPQDEFNSLATSHPELARVLQFAVAYNALSIIPRYSCKSKEWCLLELGGLLLLRHGLTLKRGGFIESSVQELAEMAKESAP